MKNMGLCLLMKFAKQILFLTTNLFILSQIWSQRRVGQVVLIVIDALRADFVLPNKKLSNFGLNLVDGRPKIDYVTELMKEERHAVTFVAQAHAPTVTLPRIKVLHYFFLKSSFLDFIRIL